MLNKNLIKTKFEKSIMHYSTNASIQQKMALELCSKIPCKKFNSILEIGSYTGFLTHSLIQKFEFDDYLALDIVNSFDFIKNLSSKISFKQADIEQVELNQKFDLITSNASLQWCEDIEFTIKKLLSYLNSKGIIAISIFGKDNMKEIKEVFNIGLNYPEINEIKTLFSKNALICQKIETVQFKTPLELLRHLKLTGVNAISNKPLNLSQIKKNLKFLDEKYQNKLTYNPIYIIDVIN